MRLIDADALIDELKQIHFPGAPYVDAGIKIAVGKALEAPTVNTINQEKLVETIKYYMQYSDGMNQLLKIYNKG